MKALQGLLLSACLLLSISTTYADCMNNSCQDSNCSECQCTDPECVRGNNNCMSKETCCEAFGNVGAR